MLVGVCRLALCACSLADTIMGNMRFPMKRVHPRIRSLFREQARAIIQRDRAARRYGHSQNTIGTIVTAMVKAYELGLRGVGDLKNDPLPESIRWDDLSPRARELLDWASHYHAVRIDKGPPHFSELQCCIVANKPRWFRIDNGRLSDRSYANGSVTALLKHGLLAPVEEIEGRYRMTEKARIICQNYWHRFAARDPSLPKMNIRK